MEEISRGRRGVLLVCYGKSVYKEGEPCCYGGYDGVHRELWKWWVIADIVEGLFEISNGMVVYNFFFIM